MSYAAPIWLPTRFNLKSCVASFQVVQNAAPSAFTSCHSVASQQHLHEECKVFSVKEHLAMQCKQFLLNTRQVMHSSHEVTGCPPGARPDMKPTLQRCFIGKVEKFLTDGNITDTAYKRAVKTVHTETVTSVRKKRAQIGSWVPLPPHPPPPSPP
jgi:hypothetical protein